MIGEILEQSAVHFPHRRAVVDGDRSVTYPQLRDDARRLAHALAGLGCQPGDRVALLSNNSIEFVSTTFACSLGGFVVLPLNVRLGAAALREMLAQTTPRAVVVDGRLASMVGDLAEAPEWPSIAIGFGRDHGLRLDMDEVAGAAGSAPVAQHESELVALTATSGTTGSVKLTAHTHAGVRHGILTCIAGTRLTSESRVLTALPMFFASATGGYWMAFATGGETHVLPAFDAERFVQEIEHGNITHAIVGPSPLYQVMDGGFDLDRLRSVEFLGAGGAPFSTERFKALHERLGGRLGKLYSMSEANVSSLLRPEDVVGPDGTFNDKVDSVGRPQPGARMRVVDADGKSVPTDGAAVGEVRFGRPGVGAGYWNDPDLTAANFVDGELLSGDLATIDSDGFIRIVDRKSDVIVSGGINVAPIEVEEAINSHPDVAAVAVIGVPHEMWGEGIHAVVVPRSGATLTADEVISWASERLAPVKKPRSVEFVDELPMNNLGKILRRVLRDQASRRSTQ